MISYADCEIFWNINILIPHVLRRLRYQNPFFTTKNTAERIIRLKNHQTARKRTSFRHVFTSHNTRPWKIKTSRDLCLCLKHVLHCRQCLFDNVHNKTFQQKLLNSQECKTVKYPSIIRSNLFLTQRYTS